MTKWLSRNIWMIASNIRFSCMPITATRYMPYRNILSFFVVRIFFSTQIHFSFVLQEKKNSHRILQLHINIYQHVMERKKNDCCAFRSPLEWLINDFCVFFKVHFNRIAGLFFAFARCIVQYATWLYALGVYLNLITYEFSHTFLSAAVAVYHLKKRILYANDRNLLKYIWFSSR